MVLDINKVKKRGEKLPWVKLPPKFFIFLFSTISKLLWTQWPFCTSVTQAERSIWGGSFWTLQPDPLLLGKPWSHCKPAGHYSFKASSLRVGLLSALSCLLPVFVGQKGLVKRNRLFSSALFAHFIHQIICYPMIIVRHVIEYNKKYVSKSSSIHS